MGATFTVEFVMGRVIISDLSGFKRVVLDKKASLETKIWFMLIAMHGEEEDAASSQPYTKLLDVLKMMN